MLRYPAPGQQDVMEIPLPRGSDVQKSQTRLAKPCSNEVKFMYGSRVTMNKAGQGSSMTVKMGKMFAL